MKKIIIIRNAFSFDFGGGERMPVNIANEISKQGFETIIISRNYALLDFAKKSGVKTLKGLWWSRQDWSGYKIIFTPIYFIWLFFVFLWYLSLFLVNKPDVVHAQSKDDFISATIAGKLLGKKIIWTDQADLKYIYQNINVWYKNPIGKVVWLCSKLASLIIMTGKSDFKLTEQTIGKKLPDNYQIIYNGVFDQPNLLKIKQEKNITLVATSRLVTAKGIGELISAFNEVVKKFPETKLWVLGEGPEENKFRELAKTNKNIEFLGFPKNALEYVAKAQIFVHPSYLEGFSISLIEATMLGKPIIACNVGGNPEIIESKNGILIKEKDVEQLKNALEKLIKDEALRKSMALASRKIFTENYDLSKIIKEKYLPIYEK